MSEKISLEQKIQESQYSIPYHYIPTNYSAGFSQANYWSWGMRYMAGIELVLQELRKNDFSSILDVGCGDGRFLREVSGRFENKKMLGIDYSSKAVAFANAFNPSIDYDCVDITKSKIQEKFDVVTMVEVLEHIPIEEVNNFLAGVANNIHENGRLILTVPHVNKGLNEKHYQHFSSDSLRAVLSECFVIEKIIPFDRFSRITDLLAKIIGGSGDNYIITNKKLNQIVYKRLLQHHLEPQLESQCCRLLAVAKVKN